MANLTLDQLLASLATGLDKSAGDKDADKDDKKEEKDEKNMKKEEGKPNPFIAKKTVTEKDDKKEEEKCDSETKLEKTASDQGADLAREIMEKVANLNIESVPGMKKTAAATAGKTLATALLSKLAGVGDVTTSNGIDPAGTPGKTQTDNASLVAEDDAKVKPIPTSDGNGATGSINEIFDAIIADTMAQGAASTDQVHTTGVAKAEGAVENVATPNQEKAAALNELIEGGVSFEDATALIKQAELQMADDLEKVAAVQSLVEQGIDYDTASDLVKQAALDIAAEEDGLAKAAAVSELMANGIDFDAAVEMVKSAGVGDVTTSNGIDPAGTPSKIQTDNASLVAEDDAKVKLIATSDGNQATGSINEIFDAIVADAVSQGAASTDQVHTTGVAKAEGAVENVAVPNQVKSAALAKLLEAGVDFEKAASIVKEASEKASTKALEKTAGIDLKGLVKNAPAMVKSTAGKAASAMKNPAAAGAAGAVAGALGTRAMSEKKAEALSRLLDQGIDFDAASDMVKAASAKLGV